MRDLHRGEIYEAKESQGFLDGAVITVMILQNDAGEIPCDTATVLTLRRSCRRIGWKLAATTPRRLHKRQLGTRLGRLSPTRTQSMIEDAERELGFCIPEVIEAP